ncbi:MAG TPA: hypothetical protein VGD13_01635 [Xanthobacteraceae bacterium]|jgi:hypothetical protein
MSSPKAGAARRAKPVASSAETPVPAEASSLSDDTTRVAAAIEAALADGRVDALSQEALQKLVLAACNAYAAKVESGAEYFPLEGRAVNSTAIMLMASGLLRSQSLAVFELGMWQSWSGR